MFKKIKNFFMKIIPTKRRLIQVYAALLHNANIKGFVTGEIFKGDSKIVCAPGLNCYSCPGAVGACPLGSLQNALAASKTKYPTYVIGIILLYSIILGRTICGFLCPLGLLQELLYKIKSPKLKKSRVTRILSYFKYVLLAVLVIGIPLIYGLQKENIPLPGFCKYICPSGTLLGAISLLANPNNASYYGMLGSLFTWKFILLVIFVVASIFIFRFFCRFLCPLGAIYGIFNKLSILGVKVDKEKCNSCGACINHCKMDIKEVGDHECIQCGECKNVCHASAIDWKVVGKLVKEKQHEATENDITEVKEEMPKKRLSRQAILNLVTTIVLSIILIVTIIYANFGGSKVVEVNTVCEELVINISETEVFDISKDDGATIFYFYDDFNLEVINQLDLYADEKLKVIAVSSYDNAADNKNKIKDLDLAIIFAFDDSKNSAAKTFMKNVKYPYFIYMDNKDKVIIKQESMITETEYLGIIYPNLSGKNVGNAEGDICISKNLNLITSDGTISILENRGKIIVLNFWYTGCTPCVKELPYFNNIATEYQDEVVVIAIHEAEQYLDDPDGVKEFIDSRWNGWNVIFACDDPESPYSIALGSEAFPATVIIDQEGIIYKAIPHALTEEELRNHIENLIK